MVSAKKVYLPATIALILLFSMTLMFCWSYYSQQAEQAKSQFKVDAMVYTHAIERELERSQQVVSDLAALFQSIPQIDRQAFATLAAEKLKHHTGIQALEWVPKVTNAERQSYEETARADYPNFYFYTLNEKGERIPTPASPVYFPVYFLEPLSGNEDAFGYTPTNYSARDQVIHQAIMSGQAVASQRIQLIQEKQGQFGVLIFSPVFKTRNLNETFEERMPQVIGLILGVFRVGDLIENALKNQNTLPLNLAWFDLSSQPESQFLYWYRGDSNEVPMSQIFNRQSLPKVAPEFLYDDRFDKLGRHWQLLVYPQQGAYIPSLELVISYLIIGSALSVLFAVAIYRWRRSLLLTEQDLSLTVSETRSTLNNKEQALRRQNAALTQLACNLRGRIKTLDQSLEDILEVTAETMQVERVSAWFLAKNNRLIRCQSLYERSKNQFSKGNELHAKSYPDYFAAVLESEAIIANDANSDPRTSEFSNDYLKPLNIGAMLDIPLRYQGEIVGVICLEHIGGTRNWTTEEIHFATSIANFISLAVESIRRQQAEQDLRQTSERLSLINSLTNSIRAGMSIEELIEVTLKRLHQEFPNYRVTYSTITKKGIIRVLRCCTPDNMPSIEGFTTDLNGIPQYFGLLKNKHAVIINDVANDRRIKPFSKELLAGKSLAILDMPLAHFSDLVGLICLDAPFLHHWLEHEISTLRAVAEFLELAIRDAKGQEAKRKAEKALAQQKDNLEKLVKERTAELERRAQLELIVANFSTEFINLSTEEYSLGIQRVLQTIGKFCNAESCSFMEIEVDEKTIASHQEWCVSEETSLRKKHPEFTLSSVSWSYQQFKRNQILYLHNIEDLPPLASQDKKILEGLNIKTLVVIPVIYGLKLAGLFQLNTQNYHIACNPDDLTLFQLVGNMLMNAAERNRYDKELRHSEKLLQKSNKKLKTLATIDGLTGIANRRHFDAQLQSEFRRAQREQYPISILFFDIDYFKQFNDEYGHIAGDLCLKRVAETMQAQCQRASELVARYGGEEFVVILANVSSEIALATAERIRHAVMSLAIVAATGADSHFLTLSGGVASWIPSVEHTPQQLLQAADRALYQAKFAGRNCIKFANNQNVVNFKMK